MSNPYLNSHSRSRASVLNPRVISGAALTALAVLAVSGCDAYAAERAQAEANHVTASAQLQSTLALSQTVGTLVNQNERLVNTVTAQASAWPVVVVILSIALMFSIVLAVAIVASRRREVPQAPVFILPASPTRDTPVLLDNPDAWRVSRADMRAMRLAAQRRELEARYRLTDGR